MSVVLQPSTRLASASEYASGICDNASCTAAANAILSDMDAQADPCTDFYQFTCNFLFDMQ